MTPSTSLESRVGWLVDQPGYRALSLGSEPLHGPEMCWRCTKADAADGSTLCGPCRAWLVGDSDERPWSPGRNFLDRSAEIIGEMTANGWLAVPEGERREIL